MFDFNLPVGLSYIKYSQLKFFANIIQSMLNEPVHFTRFLI
jgi:hypothetical protein